MQLIRGAEMRKRLNFQLCFQVFASALLFSGGWQLELSFATFCLKASPEAAVFVHRNVSVITYIQH